MLSRKMIQKVCAENLKNVFWNEKKWFQERSSSARFFFMFILLISNHIVYLVQFGINLHLRVFQFQLFQKLTRAN